MTEALLLTGLFGTGKTTIAADLAEMLDASPVRHAAIDLDWLTWTNTVATRNEEHHMMLSNLRLITDNYRRVGVQRFILARTILDRHELTSLREAIGTPLRVIQLTLPLREIERRLAQDPTRARRADLAQTRAWVTDRTATGFADLVVNNLGTVRETSAAVAQWMGWQGHEPDREQFTE